MITTNNNKTAEINIMSADFKKGAGVYSQQDPYIRFLYNDTRFKTTIKKNSGATKTEWNEVFKLGLMKSPNTVSFIAMGKNLGSDDFIGESEPVDLTQVGVGRTTFDVQLFDKNGNE